MSKVVMYKRVTEIGDFILRIPLSGGKAGRGFAKTSNVQVIDSKNSIIKRRFKFIANNFASERDAVKSAIHYAQDLLIQSIIKQ